MECAVTLGREHTTPFPQCQDSPQVGQYLKLNQTPGSSQRRSGGARPFLHEVCKWGVGELQPAQPGGDPKPLGDV